MSVTLPGGVHVATDAEAVAAAVAAWLQTRIARGRAAPPRFSIALSGGSTPGVLFDHLAGRAAERAFDWPSWEVFYSDERACPPDDARSNHHLASTRLLSRVPIDPARVHRVEAERSDLDAAAGEYSQLLAATLPPGPAGAPRLDVILLGLGENGHTASLFPGDPVLEVTDRWAARSRADYEPYERVTLTLPALNAGGAVAFLVTGAGKRQAFADVAAGTAPAARVRPADGELHWFLDSAAAATLS